MNSQQENQTASHPTSVGQDPSIGKKLREAREQLGLSVNDVANRIKFAPRQIEWLEADDFIHLPEATFVRGFIRSYARLVSVDPVSLLSGLPASHVQMAARPVGKPVEIAMPTTLSLRRHNIIWLAAALLIALSLAIFERMKDRQPGDIQSGNLQSGISEENTQTVIQPLVLPVTGDDGEALPLIEQARLEQQNAASTPPIQAVPPLVVPAQPAPAIVPVPPIVKQNTPPAPAVTPAALPQKQAAPKVAHSAASSLLWHLFPQKTAIAESSPVIAKPGNKPPAVAKVKTAAEIGVTDHALRLEFAEDAWVVIKDGSGALLISKLHKAGSLVRVVGKPPVEISLSNAHAVQLFDNGKKINLERHTTDDVAYIKLK